MDKKIQAFTRICLQPDNPHEYNGTWSEKPACSRSCPDPYNSNFRNGSIQGNAYFYPETISLNCAEGHELVGGGSYYQCNQSGQWQEISKPSDEALQQANERINSELEKVKACISPKSNSIKTRHFPTKVTQFPTCQPKYCMKPVVNSHCTLVSRSFHYPNKVMFDRNYGYCVVGSNSSQCNSQGLWSKASPTCERIQCLPLSDPEHGTVQLSSEQRFVDDTAVYSCHSGYDLNMDKKIQRFTRTCLQLDNPHECKGTWSEKSPCSRSCPDPNNSNFRNGSIQGNAYFYPETISLNCAEGHELVGGGSYFRCNQSGQWHEISKPSDEALQQATDRINSELKKLKACISSSSNSIKTRHFPTKVTQFPTCQSKYCRKPVVNSHCSLVSRSFHYPNKVMFDRNYGYCVVGSNSSECNSQGLWSKASPTCERIQCPSLTSIRNGGFVLNKDNRYVDTKARYTCNRGYDLLMDAKRSSYDRQCRQARDMKRCEGYWSGRKPCCIPRSCPNPKPFVNGTVIGDNFFFPETISISCDVGHELTKYGPVYQCNETGSWVPLSGPLPKWHKPNNLRTTAKLQLVQTCLRRNSIQTKNFGNFELNFARCERKNSARF
ncbi:sushi, von Willebrand factor type A, EGF and pentraxin domain-containing protein 1-like [Corticium candelabrum]|uniref:sushi, von Willebrand factor type A, EGF and pentraxin domain-containing protein 1-like n=1 Tax=Corticium candelabrum TaxID=121492 RepID=UPI002E275EBB|nr:sushi, von Willebrand factor type A, EGF and pentraxin domain-containing protein 1-like [Corticium candelabrum]